MLIKLVLFLNWFILFFLILLAGSYILILCFSLFDVYFRYKEIQVGDILTLTKDKTMPPVTVIIAAYNEESSILNAVDSVLNSSYPNTNVIVVNDGSTDQTLDKLLAKYKLCKVPASIIPHVIQIYSAVQGYYISELFPTLTVIDKTHLDKSDSLNVGLNACRTPLCITIDADSIIDQDTISEMIYYMLTSPHAVAVGGGVYILNNCKMKEGKIIEAKIPYSFLLGWQACEYLRSFLFMRDGWNAFGGSLSFSGTCTLFEYKPLLDIGGFDIKNAACDFEVITNLHEYHIKRKIPYKIGFTPAASVWTEVPSTLKEYWKQRYNWQIGQLRSLLLHREMFLNPKYGIFGFFTYPFFLLGETFGPIIELTAYVLVILSWMLGILDGYATFLLFIICLEFVTLLTMFTLLMSVATYNRYRRIADIPWILLLSIVELFGFRQYNVVCRVVATISYFWRNKP